LPLESDLAVWTVRHLLNPLHLGIAGVQMRRRPDTWRVMGALAPLVVASLDEAPGPGWDETVATLGGCVFHSRGFGLACADLGGERLFLVFRRDGRDVGYAVATSERTRWRPLGWARDRLSLGSPPVLAAEATRAEALQALGEFARRRGYSHVHISSFGDPRPTDPLPTASSRLRRTGRLEYRVPLGPDFPATLARMSATHRRKVRKALEAGFVFEEQSTLEGALRVHAAHTQTFERRQARGEEAGVWDIADFQRRMEAYLRHGIIRFHFTVQGGETLTAIGTMPFGRTAYYLVGGSTPRGIEQQTGFAMFGYTIQRLVAEGVTEFNLGGTSIEARDASSAEHGLYRYKAGYGGQVLELAHLDLRVAAWPWWPVTRG